MENVHASVNEQRSTHSSSHPPPNGAPPEAVEPLWKGRILIQEPIRRFLELESASGKILLLVAAAAMVWANLSHETYEHVWHMPIGFSIGGISAERTLHFAINEGLMSVFFLLVGLEIKREAVYGELSNLKRASLPIIAAVGGMAAPAAVYVLLNPSMPELRGAAIPSATDIAFAVGVLALLGNRVPPAIRVLLLTLAVADDIGAIAIIAVFYNSGIAAAGLVTAVAGLLLFLGFRAAGLRPGWFYFLPLAIVWYGLLDAGIHPTLAGVGIGLLVPAKAWIDKGRSVREINRCLSELASSTRSDNGGVFEAMRETAKESLSPLERLQKALHPPVAFVIMPLFALANAGVYLGGDTLGRLEYTVGIGVALGLVLGKPLGVMLSSALAVRSGICQLPKGVTWKGILLVGILAGIGFTMSNFTALLSFEDEGRIGTAKLFILIGSLTASVLAIVLGPRLLPERLPEGAARTESEAEASDDA